MNHFYDDQVGIALHYCPVSARGSQQLSTFACTWSINSWLQQKSISNSENTINSFKREEKQAANSFPEQKQLPPHPQTHKFSEQWADVPKEKKRKKAESLATWNLKPCFKNQRVGIEGEKIKGTDSK